MRHENYGSKQPHSLISYSLNKRKYILTDEYFNDLTLFNEPVTMFFRAYDPLNHENQAIVYVVEDDGKIKETNIVTKEMNINFTQMHSMFIFDIP